MHPRLLKTGFYLLFFLGAFTVRGQFYSHCTFYDTEGVKFTVYLDGEKQNEQLQDKVRIINLTYSFYSLKIVFENPGISPITRRVFFVHDALGYPVDVTYILKKNKKGVWGLHWKSEMTYPGYIKPEGVIVKPQTPAPDSVVKAVVQPCSQTVSDDDFEAAVKGIGAGGTEDGKLLSAKQFVSTNCVSTAQVKKILQLFNDERKKLDMAQYAYPYTHDKGNYFKLNEDFKDDKNVDKLYKSIAR